MADVDLFSEFYVVEKSVEVVAEIGGQTERVCVDALRDSAGNYTQKPTLNGR